MKEKLSFLFISIVFLGHSQTPHLIIPKGHLQGITSVCFSPDGKFILSGSRDNTAKLWNTLGQEIETFYVDHEVLAVAFSPDAKQQFLYVVDSGPMRVVIFDRATMTQIGAFGNRSSQPGDFDIVHHMAADSKGNLYTAEIVTNRRAQRFVLQKK